SNIFRFDSAKAPSPDLATPAATVRIEKLRKQPVSSTVASPGGSNVLRIGLLAVAIGLLTVVRADEPAPPESFTPEQRKHWAYQPPRRPELPAVKEVGWVRNPIDRFILAGLQELDFTHAPEADKSSLLRRVTFDLTGLPPTPGEVDA